MNDQLEWLYENELHDYCFTRGNPLFYAINTNNKEYESHIDALKNAIEETETYWIIVTMHYSLFGGEKEKKSVGEVL